MDREEMIKRPRKDKRRGGPKKFVMCSKWDPRQPNVHKGMKMLENMLYENRENEKCFPRGSIISGFRRQKNLGEIVAPSKPVRVARLPVQGGCFPCDAPRACTLHQSGALQRVNSVVSRYDGVRHFIRKRINCNSPNVIYYILCPCRNPADYVGSTKNMKSRWSKHKYELKNSNLTACGLTRHFGESHRGDMEAAIAGLQVILLDKCEQEEDLKAIEDRWMCDLGTLFVGLNSHNEVLNNRSILNFELWLCKIDTPCAL